MTRSLAVANAEFQALIRTKFFIVGILLVPIMVVASFGFTTYAQKQGDTEVHRLAVIDRTGLILAAIQTAAAAPEPKATTPVDPDATPDELDVVTKPSNLEIVPVSVDGKNLDDVTLELSSEVKAKTLFGFVDIPPNVISDDASEGVTIDYFTENVSNHGVPSWLNKVINQEITRRRFEAAHVDLSLTDRLSKTTRLATRALVERAADGSVTPAREVHRWETFAVPLGLMYLLFLAVMMSAPYMLNAVIEEKMSRISEVLLASVTPTQLLAGKLLGIASVSVLLALIYLAGGIYFAFSSGEWGLVQLDLLPWFIVFLLCAVLIFGSVFLSIGAACSDLKDAQSMMQPSMFFLLIPIFMAPIILSAPNSTLSIVVSLVPTATPFLMLLRLAMTPPPPVWQVALSLVLTAGTAMLFVWAAGRIFRVGLLMQGKAPNLPELIKWIRA